MHLLSLYLSYSLTFSLSLSPSLSPSLSLSLFLSLSVSLSLSLYLCFCFSLSLSICLSISFAMKGHSNWVKAPCPCLTVCVNLAFWRPFCTQGPSAFLKHLLITHTMDQLLSGYCESHLSKMLIREDHHWIFVSLSQCQRNGHRLTWVLPAAGHARCLALNNTADCWPSGLSSIANRTKNICMVSTSSITQRAIPNVDW